MTATTALARKLALHASITILIATLAGCGNDPADPCSQKVCDAPPATACTGSQLVSYQPAGTCTAGLCVYTPSTRDCPSGCRDGKCIEDPCAGVSCSTAPASVCEGNDLRAFDLPGACASGSCMFTSSLHTCPFGCSGGACIGDPCVGVTCATPTPNSCDDATHLRVFDAHGTCDHAMCSYASSVQVCAFGCDAGKCKEDPCIGVTCATPDANRCDNATDLRTFNPIGTCSAGVCSYAPTVQACAFGCENGKCKADPCTGVTCMMPEANRCETATTLRSFSPTGTCSAGSCSYTSALTTCALGCANGHCNADPCLGVSCNMPQANHCENTTDLRTFNPAGTCSNGACSYTSSVTTCALGCANGKCNVDPCAGVTCTTPDANHCESTTQLRTFSATGTCSAGTCSYTSSLTTCAFGCANDKCSPDPSICTAQPTLGTCDEFPDGCLELTGASYADPDNTAANVCPNYQPGSTCKRSQSVGGCLVQCGTPFELINFYPTTMTEASARQQCTSISGIWVGN